MKSLASRILATSALAVIGWLVIAGAASKPASKPSTRTAILAPDKLVLLSTTDVKGKTAPCG
jgi:hypothetical protein